MPTSPSSPSTKSGENRALQFIEKLKTEMQWFVFNKKEGEVVHIFYGGGLGVLRAIRIFPMDDAWLQIVIKDDAKGMCHIIAPVEECSFMFVHVVPKTEEPIEDKIVLGFADETKPADKMERR